MIGVPFKPLLEIKKKQCGTLEVIWAPSTLDSGGGPVTGFLVQLRNKDHDWLNCTTFPTKQSCLFKYLLSDTDYDIRVQAVNQKGWSDMTNATIKTAVTGVLIPNTV